VKEGKEEEIHVFRARGVKEERRLHPVFYWVFDDFFHLLSPQLLSPLVSPSFPKTGTSFTPHRDHVGQLLSPPA
jgi:hypothetical protein